MSFNLRTVVFIVCTSLSFLLSILYQKKGNLSKVRYCRGFKSRRFAKSWIIFFAEFFAPKRQKSLVKQGFLPQVVKSSCNDEFPQQNRSLFFTSPIFIVQCLGDSVCPTNIKCRRIPDVIFLNFIFLM